MRTPAMAILVVSMLLASAMYALAATPGDLSSEPNEPTLSPDQALREPKVRVEDIGHYLDDQDGDKLFDAIQVVTKLWVNTTGDLVLATKLGPRDGSWWLSTQEPFSVAEGTKLPTELYFGSSFEGWKLNAKRVNGYLVVTSEVTTALGSVVARHAETLDDDLQYTEFEPAVAGAKVVGVGATVKIDTDGNGRYEIAALPVQVEATTPGLYRIVMVYQYWRPGLATPTADAAPRPAWQTVTNETQLSVGLQEVPMWVSGGHLMTSPNITVWISIYKSAFAGQAYSTPLTVTNQREWELPDYTIFANQQSEEGKDTDGDRLYDVLHVRVGLDITYAGDYTLTAVLVPSDRAREYTAGVGSWTDYINRLLGAKLAAKDTWTAELGPGRTFADFHFDGRLINAWGADGSFNVYVYWWGPAAFLASVFAFKTIEFRANDFTHPVPPLEFGLDHTDKGVPKAGDGLLDGLQVTFNVFVNTPGEYTAFAILYHDGAEVAYARLEQTVEAGPARFPMVFPGQSIYLSRARGTFEAVIWVQGAGYDWNDTSLVAKLTARHTTGPYSWEDFTPPRLQPGPKDPQPVEDLDFILLRTDLLSVRIERSKPDLTFYVASDEGRTALFKVLYTRLLAFGDANGDGAPQASEVTYTSALLSYDWKMTQVSLADDAVTGRVATFSLSTTVDLVEKDVSATDEARPLATIRDFARLTLMFTLASMDSNRTDDVGTYVVLGGAELKVDVHIEVLTPVDGIDFLTIEQILRDDRDRYRPTVDGRPDASPGEDVSPLDPTSELKQRIEFRERAATPAFYSWVKRAEATLRDGSQEVVDVRAAFLVTDGSMLLYLSYPYDVNVTYILHDPSLGVFEDGFPSLPEEWKAVFDPLLYGVAALAAVAMVSALRGRSGREEEELEDEGEDMEVLGDEKGSSMDEQRVHWDPGPPDDGIPSLPDEPTEEGSSTILLHPPPQAPPSNEGSHGPSDGWSELR